MSVREPDEAPGSAEGRVEQLLGTLAGEPVPHDRALVPRVARVARRQRALRTVLAVIGGLAGTLAEGLGVFVRRRGGRG